MGALSVETIISLFRCCFVDCVKEDVTDNAVQSPPELNVLGQGNGGESLSPEDNCLMGQPQQVRGRMGQGVVLVFTFDSTRAVNIRLVRCL